MPTYDYVCRFCDHEFEHFQGIHDALLRKCPECSRHGLKRLFGIGAGVVFKGSGFYETDYKRKGDAGRKPDSEKSDSDKSSSGKPGDGKAGNSSSKDGSSPATKSGGGKDDRSADKGAGDKPA